MQFSLIAEIMFKTVCTGPRPLCQGACWGAAETPSQSQRLLVLFRKQREQWRKRERRGSRGGREPHGSVTRTPTNGIHKSVNCFLLWTLPFKWNVLLYKLCPTSSWFQPQRCRHWFSQHYGGSWRWGRGGRRRASWKLWGSDHAGSEGESSVYVMMLKMHCEFMEKFNPICVKEYYKKARQGPLVQLHQKC